MGKFNVRTTKDDSWLTPKYIIDVLGEFDLDPCCPETMPWTTAKVMWASNGLDDYWFGRVWLNPPYGDKTAKWLERMSEYRKGIALIFARTDTKWWHRYIFERARSLFFFEGRLKFYDCHGNVAKSSAPAPSVLVAWSVEDSVILENANFEKGSFVSLRGD